MRREDKRRRPGMIPSYISEDPSGMENEVKRGSPIYSRHSTSKLDNQPPGAGRAFAMQGSPHHAHHQSSRERYSSTASSERKDTFSSFRFPNTMMYTPSPAARRPRPPTSLAKSRLSTSTSSSSSSHVPRDISLPHSETARSSLSRVSASPRDIGEDSVGLDNNRNDGEATSSNHPSSSTAKLQSQLNAQPSPPPPYGQQLPDITHPSTESRESTPQLNEVPEQAERETSQDRLWEQEEQLRARRATEAARAIGLDMDFGANSGGDEDSELEEDEAELRRRLRSVRKRLRQRDKELLMAAQVADQALRQHEQVLSQLSPTAKSHLPQLLSLLAAAPARSRPPSRPSSRNGSRLSDQISPPSSRFRHHVNTSVSSVLSTSSQYSPSVDANHADPSPDRLRTFRLVNGHSEIHRKASRPRAFQAGSTSSQRYHHVQAEESDERIIALEAALMEAQTGEENQRKAMARMKRDHEKLKRDLERAEGMLSDHQSISGLPRIAGARGVRMEERRDGAQTDQSDRRSWYDPRRDQGQERESSMERSKLSDQGDGRSVEDRQGTSQIQYRGDGSIESTYRQNLNTPIPSVLRAAAEGRRVRKAVSRSSFLSPPRPTQAKSPLTPKVNVQSPEQLDSSSSKSPTPASTIRGSPSPSFHSRTRTRFTIPSPVSGLPIRSSPSPARSLTSIASNLSPGFSAITDRMATMRDFVADSLFLAPTPRMARTLGSELGSEYGDEWRSPAGSGSSGLDLESSGTGNGKYHTSGRTGSGEGIVGRGEDAEWEDEPDGQSGEDDISRTTFFNSPANLPPLASAALSSLALALAPPSSWTYATSPSTDSKIQTTTKVGRRARRLSSPSPRISKFAGSRSSRANNQDMELAWETRPTKDRSDEEEEEWSDTSAIAVKGRRQDESEMSRLKGKGKAPERSIQLGLIRRPKVERASSSQSSLALAHRRVSGQSHPTSKGLKSGTTTVVGLWGDTVLWRESKTIPGRLVHDLLVWLVIILESIEALTVLGVKVFRDLKKGHEGVLARQLRDQAGGRRRYYL